MWPVGVNIVAPKAAMLFLSTVLDLRVFVNNTKSFECCYGNARKNPFTLVSSYEVFLPAVNNTDLHALPHFILHVKCPVLLFDLKKIWSSSADFRKSLQYQISRKFVQR